MKDFNFILIIIILYFILGLCAGFSLFKILEPPISELCNIDISRTCADNLHGIWFQREGNNFVCVDVTDEDLSLAYETCRHEIAHELYYRDWARNRTKDFNYTKSENLAEFCQIEENFRGCLENATNRQ